MNETNAWQALFLFNYVQLSCERNRQKINFLPFLLLLQSILDSLVLLFELEEQKKIGI